MAFDLQSFHSLYKLNNTSLIDQCIALLTNQWGGSYDSRLHYLLDINKLKDNSIRNNNDLIHNYYDDKHYDSIDSHGDYHRHDYDHDHDHISRSCSWILLDHNSTIVIGHARISPMRQNTSNDFTGSALSCILTSIVIHSEYRNQGIGRYLMNRIEQIAITIGYYHIYLWTTDAIDFYRKLHYRVCDNYGLSSNVSVFDYISTKRLNSIESLLLKQLSTIQQNNDNNYNSGSSSGSSGSYCNNDANNHSNSIGDEIYDTDSHDHTGKSVVWLRKRIKDMCPFIFIPEMTLKTYITDNFNKQHQYHRDSNHHHLEHHQHYHLQNQKSDIYHSSLQSSYSFSSHAFIHMINDPQQGRFGIHWSQQVGPSCGIQAIRFAIDILLLPSPSMKLTSQSYSTTEIETEPDMGLPSFQLIHDNHESIEINNSSNSKASCSDHCGPHFTISIPSSSSLLSSSSATAAAAADPLLPSTTLVNEQPLPHNFLQEAIQLEYTTEGAIYNLHHIVDLIHRYSCSHGHDGNGGNGGDQIKAKMMSVKESIKRPRDLCDLLMSDDTIDCYKDDNDFKYISKVMTTKIIDSRDDDDHDHHDHHHHHHHHRGLLIFPYDRDECMSEPCNKGGSKAHYALIIGYIIINNNNNEEKMKKKYASLTVGCDATTTTIVDPFSSMVNYVDYDNTSSTNNNDVDITAACNDNDHVDGGIKNDSDDDSVANNDLDIDDDIYLIGIHGLSKHPIVAPYKKWIASNQQLNDKANLSTSNVSHMDKSKYNDDIYGSNDNLKKYSYNNLAGNFVYVSVGT